MSVRHSPTPETSKDIHEATLQTPSARLAALTRKKNQIKELLTYSSKSCKRRVEELFQEYQQKVKALELASDYELNKSGLDPKEEEKFRLWLAEKQEESDQFEKSIEIWLTPELVDEIRPQDSVSNNGSCNRSHTSRSSVRTTSSVRRKLAEEKAITLAEIRFQQERAELEMLKLESEAAQAKQKIQYENQLKDLKLREKLESQLILEGELDALDRASHVSRSRPGNMSYAKEENIRLIARKPESHFQSQERIQNSDQLAKVFAMLARNQERASLPKNEPEVFDGSDLTKYNSFQQAFQRMIECRCESDSDKLYYLEKYTAEGPQQLVRSCIGGDASAGYIRAKKLLSDKYGNPYRIANAYLSTLEKWPQINSEDGVALEQLAVYLMSCANNMKFFDSLQQLNIPKELANIVEKLPYDLRKQWRNHTYHIMKKGCAIKFDDLVQFVNMQSSILNQPLFGKIKDSFSSKPIRNQVLIKKTFSTKIQNLQEENRSNLNCLNCKKDNHTLENCFFFMGKDHSKKIEFIKANKLCFGCLKVGHNSKYCQSRMICKECQGRHPTILHRKQVDADSLVEPTEVTNVEPICTTTMKVSYQTGVGERRRIVCTALPVIVRAKGSNCSVKTYMGLDTFSTDCFMSETLLVQLGIKGINTKLNLTTMEGKFNEISAKVINNLDILDLDENERATIPVIYSKTNWPFNKNDSPKQDDQDKFPYLKEVPIRFIDAEIGILIGINMPDIMKPLDLVDSQDGGPYATRHKLGWAISGPIYPCPANDVVCNRIKIEHHTDLENKIEQMYSHDYMDSNIENKGPSIEDQKWQKKVESSMMWKEGHFEVGLPFRNDKIFFPDNYSQVYRRLQNTKRRLKNDDKYFQDYNDFMDTMLKKGFAECVPDDEINTSAGSVWYLAHHGIYNKQKKKLRVVFDCSLKFKGISLNSELLQGPDLTNNLLGVLLRFRQGKIAFMGDIEAMFYQVKVPKEHIDFMRFLWFPDGNLNKEPVEYRLVVHVFGAVSSPSCSNFVLRYTSQIKDDEIGQAARTAVLNDFYVDDLLKSIDNDEHAISMLKDIEKLVAKGGFNLTGFVSNSRVVLRSIPTDKLSKHFRDLDLLLADLPDERTLGVVWNVEQDTINFRPKLKEQPCTRRGILSTIFSIYDPLGIVGPVIIPAKRIFQLTCRAKLQWDEKLPDELRLAWQNWLKEIHLLTNFEIPRCYNQGAGCIKGIQLHIFCDGSDTAYGAVAYLRFQYENEVSCSLIMAKTRLTPISSSTLKTVPRIELNAARLAITIQQILHTELELQPESEYFWTDSTTVLSYINCETRRFQRFVSNRVTFIRSHSNPDQWKHISSKFNPADQASRGLTVTNFINDRDWKFGPKFLLESEDRWPNIKIISVADDDAEIKKNVQVFAIDLQGVNQLQKLLDSSSSWYKTKLKIAWFLRYKLYLCKNINRHGEVSVNEMKLAEIEIWRIIQKLEYSDTIARIQSGQSLRRNDPLLKFNPFLDDGLLRIGGRLQKANTSYEIKHPIILPKTQHVVKLLIENIHRCVGHLGKESILSTLRRQYWIIAGSRLIRRVTRNCVACRRRNQQPSSQIMADLPSERVTGDAPAFTNVGIDYFGPFLVTIRRSTEKRYGVIFTCLSSRAIHLEISHSLDTDSFLCALRRFITRRGNVRVIRSDNGTNLIGGNRELNEAIKQWNLREIENSMKQKGIDWKFQPPAASHFGGIWEREIRTIRKVLDALVKEKPMKMTDELLSTLMCEVEGILNNRPLTELSSDPNDLEALTPNHLLMLSSGVTYPPGLFSKDDLYAKRRWKQVQYLADLFWTRWRREYLPMLQSRQKWMTNKAPHQVGDLVLIIDNVLPRNQWSMGRIVEAKSNEGGCVRRVKIRVSKIKTGEKFIISHNVIERPIVKLILLRSVEDL